jgi:hypothetical protein
MHVIDEKYKREGWKRTPIVQTDFGGTAMGSVARAALAFSFVVALGSVPAFADGISDNVVKIGVLTDMSGQFSHESGEGAVTAVRIVFP